MVERQRVLIAGCGDVGIELARELHRGGAVVFGLRRRTDSLPDFVRPFAADLGDPATLLALPPDLDAVVYAAAAGASDEPTYRRTYVDGPRCLVEALVAQRQRPARLLFASSTAVYAQDRGEVVDESSPTEPEGFRGSSMLDGERVVLGGPFPATVVRFGGIYGPGRTWLIDAIRAGRLGVTPDGRSAHTNRIHRDDAARCLAHLLRSPSVAPIYLAVDTEPAPMDDVVRFVAAQLGIEPVTVSKSMRRGGDKRCSSARLVASGFRFRYPTHREGYRDVLRGGG